MKQLGITLAFLVVLAIPLVARAERIKASLIGFEEVPAVSTVARGEFQGTISEDEQSIEYELTYSGLQGTVTQAHIHVAQRGVNGSIVIWLCGTDTNPSPMGPPPCPPSGTVTGKVTAADVVAGSMTSQQLEAG
jgi:CHRD domain